MENTSIYAALPVLSFQRPELGTDLWKQYQGLAFSRLSELIQFIAEGDGTFRDLVEQTPKAHLRQIATAPEMWFNVNYVDWNHTAALREVLVRAIRAQAAFHNRDLPAESSLWTIHGDFFRAKDQPETAPFLFEAPHLLDTIPVDFLSPYCTHLSNHELGEDPSVQVANYEPDRFGEMVEILDRAVRPISEQAQFADFLRTFTRHLVLKINPNVTFSSGSNGWFIGRTVLANAEATSPELLADALIHEAAHAYLYMLEELQPWMPERSISQELGRTVASDWTGNLISLRSFSQAVFIWYTLYHFWSGATAYQEQSPEFVAERLAFIRNGFERLNLDRIQMLARETLPENTLEVFQTCKEEVISTPISVSL